MVMTINGTPDSGSTVQPGTARQEFGAQQMTTTAETASAAAAAQAEALVKARYMMALHRPRDWMQVRQRLLNACMRPGFCTSARYRKPIGGNKYAEGWSVRFAEEAVRCMTNLHIPSMVIFDDGTKRIVQQTVTDLESNATYSLDVTIEKTVERSQVRDGQEVLGIRKNSRGKTTYLIAANEGELVTKEAALMSKALRNLALRLLPGDIQDDCLAQYNATLRGDISQNRLAAITKLSDAFNGLGIQPKQLAEYLRHPVEETTPDEIVELRKVFSALKEGETTWREITAAAAQEAQQAAAQAQDPAKEEAPRSARVMGRIKATKEKVAEAPPEGAKTEATAQEPIKGPQESPEDEEPWKKHMEGEERDEE